MLALAAKTGAWAQSEYSTLMVETKSGDTFELWLRKKPEVHFDTTGMTFTCGEELTGYLYDEVSKLYFNIYDPVTAIAAPKADGIVRIICLDQSKVVVSGIGEPGAVRLYDLNGRSIVANTAADDGTVTVSLDGLAAGTYILNIGNKQSFKILRR